MLAEEAQAVAVRPVPGTETSVEWPVKRVDPKMNCVIQSELN